ncbi:MAG: serine/threonine protein kinase [Deltaproteobacteria bacterium]|nr:serine/threonine protein kinase [Deltaproteobacteria bacterium]
MIARIGNCQVLAEIGSGGMAVVYKALQEPLNRIVAIKALKSSIAIDSQFAQRFEREALFLASMQHENILHVHDFLKQGGTMFIVMEFVEGIDLYDLLERTPRLPVDVAGIIAMNIARALDYAHFRGIIHRDIKPANIMLSKKGEVKLMDFGIARDDSLQDLTQTGTGLGTPSYMSPEQILGDKLDYRTDIFSLGIVLYQMVTGRKPFVEDAQRSVMQKIRLDRYTSPRKVNPTVPRALERIMARCMEKLPSNRYPSAQALMGDLEEFLKSRVLANYNARMVTFLKDEGVIEGESAAEILGRSGVTERPGVGQGSVLRAIARVDATVLGLVLIVGLMVQLVAPGPGGAAQKAAAPAAVGTAYLRVVVDPWAEVWVDGRLVETTPIDRRLEVPAGVRFLELRNPYYRKHSERLALRPGEVRPIRVRLEPASEAAKRR